MSPDLTEVANYRSFLVQELSHSFGSRRVFEKLNFRIESSVTVVRGPSGCGKTTLFAVFAGLIMPNSIKDSELPKFPTIVLQSDGLLPWLSVKENIKLCSDDDLVNSNMPLEVAEIYRSYIQEIENLSVFRLSFGQRRTVELYRALISNHDLLILDEPLNS
jgi:ABC-type nitrate/sulfonate/bicarbonate transport system ATPase subunit